MGVNGYCDEKNPSVRNEDSPQNRERETKMEKIRKVVIRNKLKVKVTYNSTTGTAFNKPSKSEP